MNKKKLISILMADDDEDDRFIVQKAIDESILHNPINFVEDGQELMDYLKHEGQYQHLTDDDLPGIILLDLNMPRKDGREALAEIEADPTLKRIPVVVMTTSKAEEDILRSYEVGAASYITKPVTFMSLLKTIETVGHYWLEIVQLPHKPMQDD